MLTKTDKLCNDLPAIVIHLANCTSEEDLEQTNIPLFSAASVTLDEDLNPFYFCLQHKFAIQGLFCNMFSCLCLIILSDIRYIFLSVFRVSDFCVLLTEGSEVP